MNAQQLSAILIANPHQPLHVMLPSREFVPAYFHITEVGRVRKDFIDCGGTRRSVSSCLLQVWVAGDIEHRLDSTKLAKIIEMATGLLELGDLPVEVEYERENISQFPLISVEATPAGLLLELGTKHTACLAEDRCGVGPNATECC